MAHTVTRRAAPPRLEIRLLGPLEVAVDGRPLEVDTRKALAILAVLAADGRPYARDELAALLWPDSDDEGARGALRRTLSTLRAAVGGDGLLIDRARVDLDRSQVQVDLAEIEAAAVGAADRRQLARAADLARGDFLAGFNLRDSPEFDDWRAARAAGVERSVLAVLDRLAGFAEADGDFAAAIGAVSRRLEVDPLDESAHVRLMDLLAASGDRGGALRQYRTCVATLERELGVAPLASTTARYEAIRDASASEPGTAGTPTPAGPPAIAEAPKTHELPLVGRDDELATILAAHAEIGSARDGGRLIGVLGEAGIGKTRLVDEAVARLAGAGAVVLAATAYPTERSIAYGTIVDLLRAVAERPDAPARLDALDPATRTELARILPALDAGRAGDVLAGSPGPGAHARLVTAIADGLAALVAGPVPGVVRLDDVTWLDPASREALGALVNRLDRYPLLVVVAWRPEDLDADGAPYLERLLGGPRGRSIALDRLGRADIEALVVAAEVGSKPVDTGRSDRVDRLLAASEGLPLYVTAVLQAHADATSLPGGVRAVLRERLASVAEPTTQVLAAASVIGRSFDPATVRHASGRTEEEVVDALEEAARRAIVRETPAGFDFTHGALRDIAYESIGLTRRRLLHRRAAEGLRLDLARSGRDDLGRLALVAIHEEAAGRDAEAAEAHVTAGERAAALFANREAIDHLEAALALGHGDGVGAHESIGRLRTRLGDYSGAIAAFETAAAAIGSGATAANGVGGIGAADTGRLAALEASLARAHLRRGDLAAADHHLDAAAAGAGDDALRVAIAVDRSVLRRRRGDTAGAGAAAEEALELAERSGDRAAIGGAHRMLGLAALDAGDIARATAELASAADAAASDPDPTASIAALVGLALASAAAGRTDEAVAHGETAAAECRRIGDRHLEAAVENHLADILHDAGRDDAARPHQLRAVEAFAEVGGSPADPDPGIWMLSVS